MALTGLAPRQIPHKEYDSTRNSAPKGNNSLFSAPQDPHAHRAPGMRPIKGTAGPGMGTAQRSQSSNAAISDRDIDFLMALAAMQIQYGQPHEAVAYLMCVRRMRPGNTDILRLLALALMKMEAWNEAGTILDEMESLHGGEGTIIYLYRAIIRFRVSDLFGAKQLFARFCALKARETDQ